MRHQARIPASASGAEVLTRERCYITELLNQASVPQASLARCRVAPGVTTELHRLAVDEWYVILAGRGRMRVGDDPPFDVAAGDAVAIPATVAQCIENRGDEDLLFECLCVPRFTPGCYQALAAE